tara:strand:+ start:112 stop:252 length:141 start_codon:yes stop_codon:yes gene_type:complete
MIAVSNKLIKQSFAIAKSGSPNDKKYVSILLKQVAFTLKIKAQKTK